jgi:curved DNA-binding protein CbpA
MAEATATGTFEATPLSALLVYALDKRLDGTFVLQTPDGQRSAFTVEAGVPIKAKPAQPVIHLGRLLLELGKIDEDTYNKSLARVAKEKVLHGQLLLSMGKIDQKTLDAALSEQLLRQMVFLFSLSPRTVYGFYQGQDFLERWAGDGATLEPLRTIWHGVRRYENLKRIDTTLQRLGNYPLRIHPAAQLHRFGFSAADVPVIEVLRAKPQPLRDLLGSGVADVNTVKRVVYVAMLTRHLDVGATPLGLDAQRARKAAPGPVIAPPTESSPAGVAPPPASTRAAQPRPVIAMSDNVPASLRSPLMAALANTKAAPNAAPGPAVVETPETIQFREELEQRLAKAPNQNYYEILGVPRDAPGAAISAAFFQLAKKWHPDRLGPELASVKEDAVRLFARMTEAHQTLTDDEKRREYDELVREGGGTSAEQEEVQKVMRAVVAYQKAQVLYRKQAFAEAEKLAKAAMEDDPAQGDYLALWAQIEAQKPERAQMGRWDDLIDRLSEAIKKERDNERLRFARGEVLKRAGKQDLAIRDFKWCADNNPKNHDAVREVRIYNMRNADKGKEGGLLGKLFKR